MNITSGKIVKAQKIVVYGPEGIGKTSFAAQMPDPLFIDTEGSTEKYNVKRTPKPSSWQMLLDEIKEITQCKLCKTLVIDTADWAEKLCVQSICDKYDKKGIEDFGYGSGYVYVYEEIGRFLNLLNETIEAGIHVMLTAHAQLRKFEQPDEMGSYDRWELKLGKKTSSQTAPLIKEWADMLLFANYKTVSVATDDKGNKFKAQGGIRTMFTQHHPCWDAKNRDGLPPEAPFDYNVIAPIVIANTSGSPTAPSIQQTPPVQQQAPPQQQSTAPVPTPAPTAQTAPPPASDVPDMSGFVDIPTEPKIPENLPQNLKDLMKNNSVSEEEIRFVVSQKGYFPGDTPITNYPTDFINGCLIAAWGAVFGMIQENRKVPFI